MGTVLLSHENRGISRAKFRETAGLLVSLLKRRGIRLSASINHRLGRHQHTLESLKERGPQVYSAAIGDILGELLDDGVLLVRRLLKIVEGPNDDILVVPDKSRLPLDIHRNSLLSTIAPDCIIATALTVMRGPVLYDELSEECRKLSHWLRYEFIYQTDRSYETNFNASFDCLVADGVIRREGNVVHIQAPKTLNFYRSIHAI